MKINNIPFQSLSDTGYIMKRENPLIRLPYPVCRHIGLKLLKGNPVQNMKRNGNQSISSASIKPLRYPIVKRLPSTAYPGTSFLSPYIVGV